MNTNSSLIPTWLTSDAITKLGELASNTKDITNVNSAIKLFEKMALSLNRSYSLYETIEILFECRDVVARKDGKSPSIE